MQHARIDFHTDDAASWSLTADQILRAVQWRRTDGAAFAKAVRGGRWRRHLVKADSLPAIGRPSDALRRLLWSLDPDDPTDASENVEHLVSLFAGKPSKRAEASLSHFLSCFDAETRPRPLELLALLTLLATRRSRLSPTTMAELFRVTLLASRSHVVALEQEPPGLEPTVFRVLRRGELPLLVGHVFEAVHGSTHLRRTGRRTLGTLIDEETDTDGTPHGRVVADLPELIAPAARAMLATAGRGEPAIRRPMRRRLGQLVASAKTLHSVAPMRNPHAAAILKAANNALPKPDRVASARFPGPGGSVQTDWGGFAVLLGGTRKRPQAASVEYARPEPRLRLAAGGAALVEGPWSMEVSVDGRPLPAPAEWQSVCWYTDEESAYLELQATIENVTVTRHVVTTAEDDVMLLSTVVRGPAGAEIDVATRLRLGRGVSARRSSKYREVVLRKPAPARLVPLALPQLQDGGEPGGLYLEGRDVLVSQSGVGSVVCPVLVDLGSPRKVAGWRGLTVAEAGHNADPARAQAFQYRLGRSADGPQWVYYQSAAKPVTARTVLGHHTHHEMVFARFADGDLDPLVHVESG